MSKILIIYLLSVILFFYSLSSFILSFRHSTLDSLFNLFLLLFSILFLTVISIIYNKMQSQYNIARSKILNFINATPLICVFITLTSTPASYFLFRNCNMLPIERQCGCIYMFATKTNHEDPKIPDQVIVDNRELYNLNCEKGKF